MRPPNGLAEINATFGNIAHYIQPDGTLSPDWEESIISLIQLPYPMTLAWDKTKQVTHMRCHKLMMPIFSDVFSQILRQGLSSLASLFGGCFMYRPERASHRLSVHSWGIAIDLNPETNKMGTVGDMDPRVISIFKSAGFTWGGDFVDQDRKDPMHFQFCSGY